MNLPVEQLNSCGEKEENAAALKGSHYSGSTPLVSVGLNWRMARSSARPHYLASNPPICLIASGFDNAIGTFLYSQKRSLLASITF